MHDDDKEKKYKYYFWLDEMIMDLWSDYIDYIIDHKPKELCENKLKLIEFYQSEIDKLRTEFSFEEVYEWRKNKGVDSTIERMYRKLFGCYVK